MKKGKQAGILLCGGLAAAALTVLAASAGDGAGSQSDPLVTLSYLTDTFTSQIMDKVDSLLAQREPTSEMYVSVTLAAGQSLYGQAGCEILPRSGAVYCDGQEGAALADTTSGDELSAGAVLTVNHLYLMPAACSVSAPDGATLLVRGTYSVR